MPCPEGPTHRTLSSRGGGQLQSLDGQGLFLVARERYPDIQLRSLVGKNQQGTVSLALLSYEWFAGSADDKKILIGLARQSKRFPITPHPGTAARGFRQGQVSYSHFVAFLSFLSPFRPD